MSSPVVRMLGCAVLCASTALTPRVAATQGPRQPGSAERGSRTANHAIPVPSAHAAARGSAVTIDGRLDEAAWRAATPITDFTQVDPDEGQPATERTEVRFLFDANALYIAARMHDAQGRAGVRSNLVRRDDDFNSDYFEIVIDGYHDHLSRAFFLVNPAGSRRDMIGIGTSCCDSGWDPVWEVATHIDDDGWVAEARIPLSQLRFDSSNDTWGLQVRRFVHRRQEVAQWAFWKKSESGGPNRFGHLEGLDLRNSGAAKLELLPYAVGKGSFLQHAPGDPFNRGRDASARAGLDLKYLLTSNLTLSATFNPDFGQVEVDPAVVNLSAFETFFPEKRPFFIEGAGIFGFGGFNCYFCSNVSSLSAFYSRRVGRAPSGADLAYGAGPFADVPDAATILGAGKITGRTANGLTIGVLEAVTGRADARVQRADGTRLSQEVEPLSNYFVGRVKKDMRAGNLVVGGVLTSVARQLSDPFEPRLASHAELAGGDVRYTWNQRRYSLTSQYAISNVSGDARHIAARQRSSARYFQRPDRGRMDNGFFTNAYDTTLTSLRGAGGYLRIAKEAGDWLWEAMTNVRTPGFETNDYAFQTTADYLYFNANVVRSVTKPGRWYRHIWSSVGAQTQQNWDGDRTDVQVPVFFGMQTPQYWWTNAFVIWRPDTDDDRLLRGGPVVRKPGNVFVNVNVNTDSRKRVIGSFTAARGANTRGGRSLNLSTGAEARPTSNVYVSVNPSWNDARNLLQYVRAVNDPTAVDFAGRRHVLATLRQKTLGLDTRLNVTFSPTMTLQLYAQPFFSSGAYSEFKEFVAPRRSDWAVYGRDAGTITRATSDGTGAYTIDPDGATGPAAPFALSNPDFSVRSLRGNAVFRWEYQPGSTLFFAWAHSRAGSAPFGDFDFARDREALLADRPDNVFLVKATWWIAR